MMRKIAVCLTKKEAEKTKNAQSTHEDEYIKPKNFL